MQVSSGLGLEAVLQKLAESQFLDVVDRQQMVIVHWSVEDVQLITNAEESWPVHAGSLC